MAVSKRSCHVIIFKTNIKKLNKSKLKATQPLGQIGEGPKYVHDSNNNYNIIYFTLLSMRFVSIC